MLIPLPWGGPRWSNEFEMTLVARIARTIKKLKTAKSQTLKNQSKRIS